MHPAEKTQGGGWGGRRQGFGRKPKNRSALVDLDIAAALAEPPPEEIKNLAWRHAASSIVTLGKLLTVGEAAQRAATSALTRP